MPGTLVCYVGLGSNLGDRAANLAAARRRLNESGRIVAASSIYETDPWGVDPGQPNYLNQVVSLITPLPPAELARKNYWVSSVDLGRVRTASGDPRLIDLDLLLYGDEVTDGPGLTLPHPRMGERAFVLEPLAEIAPDMVHPVNGLSISALNARVDHRGVRIWRGRLKRTTTRSGLPKVECLAGRPADISSTQWLRWRCSRVAMTRGAKCPGRPSPDTRIS